MDKLISVQKKDQTWVVASSSAQDETSSLGPGGASRPPLRPSTLMLVCLSNYLSCPAFNLQTPLVQCTVCGETQKSDLVPNILRERFRGFFLYQTDTKILTRNGEVYMRKGYKRFVKWESLETRKFRDREQIFPRLFSVSIFFETDSETFLVANFFQTDSETFLVADFFETGSETFFGPKYF